MPLPFKVTSLDDVEEAVRDLYTETDDGFKLDVEGVEAEEDVSGLKSALEKVKRERDRYKGQAGKVKDEDLEELEALRAEKAQREEEEAKKAGKFDEIRTKLVEKYEGQIGEVQAQLQSRDKVIETLTVKNALLTALDEVGVHSDYKRAAFLELMDRKPTVDWPEGQDLPVGVFPDEIEGNKPITEFVGAWAKTDEAAKYMPPETGGGGGAGGRDSQRGKGKSWEGKEYKDMTAEEKVEYTQEKYAGQAA